MSPVSLVVSLPCIKISRLREACDFSKVESINKYCDSELQDLDVRLSHDICFHLDL